MLLNSLMSQLATSPLQGSLLPALTCSAPAQSCSDPAGYIPPQGVTAGHWLAYTACVAIEIGCVCFLISVFLLQPLGVVLSCSKKMLLQRGPAAHWGVLGADFAAVTPVPTCRSCSEGACGVSLSCWSTCCWCLVPPPHVPPPGSSAPPQAALGELPQGSPLLFQLQPALCRTSSEIKERRSVKPSSSSADGVCGSGRFLCCCNRTAWSSQEAEGEAAVWSC